MFLYNSAVNKARSLKEGDMVSWNSSGGRAEGKVVHVMDYGTLDIPNSKFKIKGEKDNPAVLIQLYRDGKPTDTQVGHKMSALRKSIEFDFFKHGSHNQKTHAGSRGKGSGDGGAAETKPNDAERFADAGYDDALLADLEEKLFDIDESFENAKVELLDEIEEATGATQGKMKERMDMLVAAQSNVKSANIRVSDASRPVDNMSLFDQHRKDVVGAVNELDSALEELKNSPTRFKDLITEIGSVKSTLQEYDDQLDESVLKKNTVEKHGSHNQKTHAGSRGKGTGGSGSGSSTTTPTPTTMPFRPTGKYKLDEALFNRLDRKESNAAYVDGWKQGQAQSKDDKLFNAANSWIDMTDKAINEGKMPNDGFLLETARAVGLINGMLQSKETK